MSARQHSKRTVIVHDWADNRLTLWRHWRDAWWRHTLALCLLANCKLLCRASVSRLRRRVGSILGRTTTARDCCADYLAERKNKQVSRKISVSIATTHPQADCFISGVLPHSAQVLLLRQVLLLANKCYISSKTWLSSAGFLALSTTWIYFVTYFFVELV